MTKQRKDEFVKFRLPAGLKAEVMKTLKATTRDKRGGLSALVREFLTAWVAQQRKSPAHRG